jgi:hypothetical protein
VTAQIPVSLDGCQAGPRDAGAVAQARAVAGGKHVAVAGGGSIVGHTPAAVG